MIELNSSVALLGLALTSIYAFYALLKLYHHVQYSPLNAAKDAHWSVKFTAAWVWWKTVNEVDAQAIHDAHVRLGPVVRVGPHEISVNDVDGGLKPIYEGRLPKTDLYQLAVAFGEPPMFAIRNEDSHRRQKRLLAKPYGKTFLMGSREWQEERAKLADDFVSGLDKLVQPRPDVELYDILFAWSMATMSTYVFGQDRAVNLLHNLPEAQRMRKAYYRQRAYLFIQASLPIPAKVFDWLGFRSELEFIRALQKQTEQAEQSAGTARSTDGRTSVYSFMRSSVFAAREKKDSEKLELSPKETAIITSEMQDHFVAGIDTSVIGLMTCAWELSSESNKHWQDRLREEVRSARNASSQRHPDLEGQPVLDAIVRETLRLHPPGLGNLPRYTDKPIILGPPGHEVMVPAGVQVSCQALSLHRKPSVFKDPDDFRPERWLDATPEERKEMDRWFWAFGSGSRKCVGEHLALGSLRVAMAAIWGNFETSTTDDPEFVLSKGLIATPLPNKHRDYLRLHVRRVQE
ncbi:cytochrome P450 [Neohortaea acidophila]|uniref:Cytochrome P450 n=1 Tax=Neohortaea acidophila TaxID=245834 RepID=A0A6A6Q4N1_9PEZI|nr:cytochrome P450 [Neohortaea acidophila]KAF2486989.1 cytochrome P450 [Neohortaea acidophila]